MTRSIASAFGLIVLTTSVLSAQSSKADSLVSLFLSHGNMHGWLPAKIFENCSDRQAWQRDAFELLAHSELTAQREADLALAWMGPLQTCHSAELEDWYMGRLEAAAKREASAPAELWIAVARSGSPRIGRLMFARMVDPQWSMDFRRGAGSVWIGLVPLQDRLSEYMRAFETGQVPYMTANGLTNVLIRDEPEAFLREIARAVRRQPRLALTNGFMAVVETVPGRVSDSARRRFAEEVKAAIIVGPFTSSERDLLDSAVHHLEARNGG